MSKRVAAVLIETLQAAGVKRCYGIVGDTLNRIAHAIHESEIEWVHMRHEEAGAFAASAEGQFTGELVACAGSCGPGSLHFINGLYEANRNRAPVILIATQVVRQDIGFNAIQEVDFAQVYKDCSVFCEMILTPEQARRKAVAACQAALTKRGVAVLVVPADISNAAAHEERPYAVHARQPIIRPSDADLDEIAAILNDGNAITIYAGAGCAGAHDEVVSTAERLKRRWPTPRGKDFVAHDNPYNVGMTGMIGGAAGYHAILNCECCSAGADFAWANSIRPGEDRSDRPRSHAYRTRHPLTLARRKHQGDLGGSAAAHSTTMATSASLKRYQKDRNRRRRKLRVPTPIFRHYLTKVINKRPRTLVCRGRRHGVGLDAAPHRNLRQTPDLRQPAARHDGERVPSAIGLQKPTLPAGGLPGRRWRVRHAARRSVDRRAGEVADQDRRL
jgi:pyruvate dehydrogenase (quinone)